MKISKIICCFLSTFMLFLINLSSSDSSQSQGNKLPYMTSNVDEVSGKSFDYIIVGGGASGCPLAATLSQKFSVLLIERGGSPYQNPLILQKKNYGIPLIQTDEHSSIAQTFVSTDGVSNHRGRVLGGGTTINGGFYSRASEAYVKKVGWDEEQVRESYEWVESRLISRPELSLWQSVAARGLIEAGIFPYNDFSFEHVEGTKIGGSLFDAFGRRYLASDLLKVENSANIIVLLNATVMNVIFHKNGLKNRPRAYGIRFIKSNGNLNQVYEAYLNKPNDPSSYGDVILSAGTLGSPQILLLSGIGPKHHLQKINIPLVKDLKEVGQKMKDNPCISVRVDSNSLWRQTDPPQVVSIANDSKIIVQSLILPLTLKSTMVLVVSKLASVQSKGTLELNNIDPRKNPTVTFNYLSKKQDLKGCIKTSRLVHQVSRTYSINMFLGIKYNANQTFTEDEMRNYCLKNVRTFYHYHGGCVIGSVVDKGFRVFGVEGLRVVDGSTLMESPGTNPMATLLMLGRYQGIKILRERNV